MGEYIKIQKKQKFKVGNQTYYIKTDEIGFVRCVKKIVLSIFLLVLTCTVVQGCKKEIKLADDEKITKYELRYCVDKDKQDSKYLKLAIDFETEEPSVIIGMTRGNQISFAVNNEEKLLDYLRETFSKI